MFEGEVVHGRELIRKLTTDRPVELIEADAWLESLQNKLLNKFEQESSQYQRYMQIRQKWSAAIGNVKDPEDIIRIKQYKYLTVNAYREIVDLLSDITNSSAPAPSPGSGPAPP
jgi:hypothetical protein